MYNYVDGQVFFQLTQQDLLDMIQPIGIVKNVMSLILRDQVIASLYTLIDFSNSSFRIKILKTFQHHQFLSLAVYRHLRLNRPSQAQHPFLLQLDRLSH